MLKACSGYAMWFLWFMIWYVHDVYCYVWKYGNVMIWYICDMNDMIGMQNDELTWDTTPTHMQDTINDKRYEKWCNDPKFST